MAFVSTINILGSGMTAQQLRLDIISENVTNMNPTRTEAGGPYRRKVAVFQAVDGRDSFRNVLARTRSGLVSNAQGNTSGGVQVVDIWEDPTDFKLKYDPSDPDANDEGYVELPNVDLVKEVADAMAASQAYSANVTAFNVIKNVISTGLEIGR